MDHVVTNIGTLRRVQLANVKDQAVALWQQSFVEDNQAFAQAYFDDYAQHTESHFFVNDAGVLVLMAFNTIEGYKGERATLIEGIAVNPLFQKRGIMASFMDGWMRELAGRYAYVFIQAYNWNIYRRYDFHDFSANHLWAFVPVVQTVSSLAKVSWNYANRPLTDMQRTDAHLASYFNCMAKSGSVLMSYQSASLVLADGAATNVTFKDQSDLVHLLQVTNVPLTFLLPAALALDHEAFKVVELNRLETKLYKQSLSGRFNYIY